MKQYIKTTLFNEEEMIFNKGDQGDCMYEVLSGSVGIYIHYNTDKQQLLTVREKGTIFGEIAMIEDIPRTAAAVALEEKTLLKIVHFKGLPQYIRENPEALTIILDRMSERIKQGRELYLQTCGVVSQYKETIDAGEKPDKKLSKDIDECLEMFSRYQRKLGTE